MSLQSKTCLRDNKCECNCMSTIHKLGKLEIAFKLTEL